MNVRRKIGEDEPKSLAFYQIFGLFYIVNYLLVGVPACLYSHIHSIIHFRQVPCFDIMPKAQPILPALLRRLLQNESLQEAMELAKYASARPHFFHSLEWLLFTVLQA